MSILSQFVPFVKLNRFSPATNASLYCPTANSYWSSGPSPFSAARDALYDAAQAPTLSDLIMPATPSPSPSLGVTGFGQEASVAKVN